MDELLTLKPKLTRLKLSGVSETLEIRISQAMREKWNFSQFQEMLLNSVKRSKRASAPQGETK